MLKNKYVAIILVIIAIIAIGNTIRFFTSQNKKSVPVMQAPPLEPMDTGNQPVVNRVPQKSVSPAANLKNTPVNVKKNIHEQQNIISFYKRLKNVHREILDPAELVWGNDPFGVNEKEISIEKKSNIKFTNVFLSAIISKENVRMCVINNVVYKEGEKKNGIYVSRIGENSVTILSADREYTINIFEKKNIPITNKNDSGEVR